MHRNGWFQAVVAATLAHVAATLAHVAPTLADIAATLAQVAPTLADVARAMQWSQFSGQRLEGRAGAEGSSVLQDCRVQALCGGPFR